MAAKKKHARPDPEPDAKTKPTSAGRAGTIALIGRPNVGKSTLLNALLGERIAITSRHAQTTRDRIAGILTHEEIQYVFLDTPGLHTARHKLGERMNQVAEAAAAECDVVIFMTEPELRQTPEGAAVAPTVREDDRAILAAIPAKTPIVLLINKIDRIKQKQVLFPLLEAYGKERDVAAIVPISALKGEGKARILAEVGKLLPEGEPLFDSEELSDKPVRFFVGEFVREQILVRTRQEVPHGVAVTVESFEEGSKLVRIAVTVHVAKESHKGILIGDGGKMLREIGTSARKRAEGLIGQKVHLETFVRTTAGWFDDAARLIDMGYSDETPARTRKAKRAGRTRSRPSRNLP
jgi:GTP-binding protein Era